MIEQVEGSLPILVLVDDNVADITAMVVPSHGAAHNVAQRADNGPMDR